ncbi:MAG: TIGR03985 family CRISPR-associated protein [Calothrix sp. MO_167.B42]|nr:TIGR03985 family CRISPR-associated protein [Calothrix sp. MO_167.B42]
MWWSTRPHELVRDKTIVVGASRSLFLGRELSGSHSFNPAKFAWRTTSMGSLGKPIAADKMKIGTREVFNHPPTIEFLKLLIPGSLKQNIAKAVRLWIILRSIYGGNNDKVKLDLAEEFTFLEWRDLFFIDGTKHHARDNSPGLHSEKCPCAKRLDEWLFTSYLSSDKNQWCASFQKYHPIPSGELESLLLTGISNSDRSNYTLETNVSDINYAKKNYFSKSLPDGRLFAVTSRNLKDNDFKSLVKLGWLKTKRLNQQDVYVKIDEFPDLFLSLRGNELELGREQFTHEELSAFNNSLSLPINGIQRFFIHTEYIIHPRLYNGIERLQKQLKQLWSKEKVPFVKLTYQSAKLYQDTVDCIVYPVCIYYYQRAPYLFAYGQIPQIDVENSWDKINWYDYRLDRIIEFREISTLSADLDSLHIPQSFIDKCWGKYPPKPDDIKNKMSEAWGFDIYQPEELLILRFDKYFYSHNIQGTERDEMFRKISLAQVENYINLHLNNFTDNQYLIKQFKSRKNSIYCKIDYRQDDNNIVMRLRAWGPKVEVILPWSLRQRMRTEMEQTYQLYI